MQMSNKIIYSLRIHIELQKRGFVPILAMPNPNNPKLMCWVYDKTEEFINTLDEIIGGGRK
jgi:hypothetical protein